MDSQFFVRFFAIYIAFFIVSLASLQSLSLFDFQDEHHIDMSNLAKIMSTTLALSVAWYLAAFFALVAILSMYIVATTKNANINVMYRVFSILKNWLWSYDGGDVRVIYILIICAIISQLLSLLYLRSFIRQNLYFKIFDKDNDKSQSVKFAYYSTLQMLYVLLFIMLLVVLQSKNKLLLFANILMILMLYVFTSFTVKSNLFGKITTLAWILGILGLLGVYCGTLLFFEYR